MVLKHVAFAPASQKQFGSRLRSPLFSAAAELAALKHPRRPTQSGALAWRRLYGEETVRKAERAWFLSEGEGSEALNRVAFFSLGQKKRVLELYRLSLSSMVASSIHEYFLMMYKTCFTHTKWKRTFLSSPPIVNIRIKRNSSKIKLPSSFFR